MVFIKGRSWGDVWVNDNLEATEQAILVEAISKNRTVPTALGDFVDFIDGDR